MMIGMQNWHIYLDCSLYTIQKIVTCVKSKVLPLLIFWATKSFVLSWPSNHLVSSHDPQAFICKCHKNIGKTQKNNWDILKKTRKKCKANWKPVTCLQHADFIVGNRKCIFYCQILKYFWGKKTATQCWPMFLQKFGTEFTLIANK
jgi:hypothetical protein